MAKKTIKRCKETDTDNFGKKKAKVAVPAKVACPVACDAACLAAAGVENATGARDMRAGTDLADVSAELAGAGGTRLLRVGQ